MSKEKPNTYPSEFRESSVKLAIESDQPIAQTARDLGVNQNTLHGWISKYSKPVKGLIWHTDRGSQYASDSHPKILKQHGIIQSMSRKGNCWDNAVSESFFHTLKTELVHHFKIKTREEAKHKIFE